jgi:hypothetical protein
MKCPTCLQNTVPDRWTAFITEDPIEREEAERMAAIYGGQVRSERKEKLVAADQATYTLDWMRCGNPDCKQLVIRIHRSTVKFLGTGPVVKAEDWFVLPRFASTARFIDPLVPAELRDDLMEAAAILEVSPRMSAVLARRILADLLEEYAGHKEYGLADRIDSFNKNAAHPRDLRENLHRFREVANLGAHAGTSDQGKVVEIERDEAEWTLSLVERLFDYLIVSPAKDKKMRDTIDAKIQAAGRKPIKPLRDDS